MTSFMKRGVHVLGGVLSLVGVIFVIIQLGEYWDEIDFSGFGASGWLSVLLLSLLYGVSNVFLAFAWGHILGHLSVNANRVWCIRVYGISQIAKYVPGNIFHFAGRQGLGMAAGIPAWPLVKTAVWEVSLISLAGGLFAFLIIPLHFSRLSVSLAVAGFVLVILVVSLLLHRMFSHAVALAFRWYILFLSMSGLVFLGILSFVIGSLPESAFTLIGAFVVAWLVGLVTPGAPAGMGVRELVLLFLLGGQIAEVDLLLVVLLGRVSTVLGDLLFFIASTVSSGDRL